MLVQIIQKCGILFLVFFVRLTGFISVALSMHGLSVAQTSTLWPMFLNWLFHRGHYKLFYFSSINNMDVKSILVRTSIQFFNGFLLNMQCCVVIKIWSASLRTIETCVILLLPLLQVDILPTFLCNIAIVLCCLDLGLFNPSLLWCLLYCSRAGQTFQYKGHIS